MTHREVLDAIPHREPFLFIDEVIDRNDLSIVCRRKIRSDEFFFKGHYPEFPIMPGVLLLEAVFQAGAILISGIVESGTPGVPVVTRVSEVKFSRMVGPGDEIEIEAELVERVSTVFFMKGKVSKEGKTCARVSFACTLADREALK